LRRAIDAGDDLGEATQRFVDRHAANRVTWTQLGAVDLVDSLKPDFEKRPPAPSARRGPTYDIRQAKPGE
jgi:hypothetical protein